MTTGLRKSDCTTGNQSLGFLHTRSDQTNISWKV